MPANFLIVCGGAGRGILSRFDDLGFDGALQIDVQDRLVQSWDGRVQTFELPVSQAIETPPNSLNSLFAYERRLDNEWKEHHIQNDHKGDYKECGEEDCQNYQRQVKHVATAIQGVVPTAISNGMSQNPIIGRSYITRPLVSAALSNYISQMSQLRPANQPEVTVWIVASTCGGTGNGIVHHVADLVKQVFGDTTLKLKFIRIGGVTYQSVNPLWIVSTFWSVLTDYGYMQRHKKHTEKLAEDDIQYCTTQEFYYIDVPDVGFNVLYREALVRSAFVAISNPAIDKEFVIRLNSCGGVFMARVGEWGRGFDLNAVYKLTLKQLKQKLDELLNPRESTMIAKVTNITVTDPFELVSQENTQLYTAVAKSTVMRSVLTGMTRISNEFNALSTLEALSAHPKWAMMQQIVAQIFDEIRMNSITRQVQLSITVDNETELLNLGGEANEADHYIGSEAHIALIRMAQYAKAKTKHYLLGDKENLGFVFTELSVAWNELIPVPQSYLAFTGGLFIGDEDRQNAFIQGVTRFLQAYFRVARCIEMAAEAEKLIVRARASFKNLTLIVERQIQHIKVDMPVEYTNCAELEETFGGNTTWIKLLRRSLTGNLEQAEQSIEFRRTVEMGASGLTEDGLKYVLESPTGSGAEQIVDQLNTNEGSNGAVWWQGMQRPNMWAGPMGQNYWFDFRIFPKLPPVVRAEINHANNAWGPTNQRTSPIYMNIHSPALGLKVYAVQGAAVAPMGNESLEIQQLVGMIIPSLSRQMPWYIDRARGGFSLTEFRMVQCTHSIGLPVRIPAALLEDPHLGLKEIVEALEDCVTFDMS